MWFQNKSDLYDCVYILYVGNRLHHIRIGTSNTSPDVQAPNVVNYDQCASQDTAMGDGETKSFPCQAEAKYVIVQLQASERLTLCEVEVFGG